MLSTRAGRPFQKKCSLISIFLLLAGQLACLVQPVFAQSEDTGRAILSQPDVALFPEVSFFLEAYDKQGNFLSDLEAEEVQVLENSQPRPVDQIKLLEPGLQISIAYNLAPVFAERSGKDSLYQKVQSTLQIWAKTQLAGGQDEFTLLSNDSVQTIHQTDPNRLAKDVADFKPDLLHSKSSLSSLSQALDLATDPRPRPNMKRALLYITALPTDNPLSILPNLAGRAAQMGVHVTVWLVAPVSAQDSKGAEALRDLASRTGGQFFLFSGAETLPDPEAFLKPLRSLYQIVYTSGIQKSGEQRVAVEINHMGATVLSGEQAFDLTIKAPNPIFLAPPSQIKRMVGEKQSSGGLSAEPESVPLKILVEFPDGYQRALKRAQLYVDSTLIAERTAEPFDQFDWNLTDYQVSARHMIQVKVEDVLGMEQSSMAIPVEILVDQSNHSWIKEQISPQRIVIASSVLLAGVALAFVLYLSGRKGWFSSADRRRKARILKDPVTQPVEIRQDAPRGSSSASAEHPSWPRPSQPRKAPAYLIRLDDQNQPVSGQTIPLARRESTFGSNPQQASCVINAPSVNGLHARLTINGEEYTLADAGSVAGTWINYSPVSTVGAVLEHGDLVHFGQTAFRFELAAPPHVRQPQVTTGEEPL